MMCLETLYRTDIEWKMFYSSQILVKVQSTKINLCLVEFPFHLPFHTVLVLDCCIIYHSHFERSSHFYDLRVSKNWRLGDPKPSAILVSLCSLLKCLMHSLPCLYSALHITYIYMLQFVLTFAFLQFTIFWFLIYLNYWNVLCMMYIQLYVFIRM